MPTPGSELVALGAPWFALESPECSDTGSGEVWDVHAKLQTAGKVRVAWFIGAPLMLACLGGAMASLAPASTALAQSAESPGVTDRLKNFFLGTPPAPQQQQANAPREELECPILEVRSGASTLTVHGPGDPVSTNVRYQATIGQTARECAVLGATMTMKVGMQGRILLGPLGGAGKLDVPVRMALVREGPEPKTLWTKLYQVPVEIAGGQTQVPFVHVEKDLTFAVPKADELDSYVVYVGFDQMGVKETKPRQKSKPRLRDR
jgi:hypothetical protein